MAPVVKSQPAPELQASMELAHSVLAALQGDFWQPGLPGAGLGYHVL